MVSTVTMENETESPVIARGGRCCSSMSVVQELLKLAEDNYRCYASSKSGVVLGRSRGYFMSARIIFERLSEGTEITENAFVFPSWQDLRSQAAQPAACPTHSTP